ncbi:ABC transporter substrate-binding protein [Micromonospora sp. BRA006-A]|nr:ABC transporter substrate-binding protein [Micromonospora sp. BRA006-A]
MVEGPRVRRPGQRRRRLPHHRPDQRGPGQGRRRLHGGVPPGVPERADPADPGDLAVRLRLRRGQKHAGGSDPWAKEWFAKNPPTGGYFNVAKATQGQEIELSANTGYPGPDPAKTPTIRISVVPAASNQRLQLQAGDIDIALGISQRDIQDLKKAPGIKVISAASNRQVAIQMSVTAAPFNDVNVRKALAYAVPYEQIINNVYGGDARAAKSPVPLDMPGYDESGYPFTYDLEKAKAAMAAAGRASLDSSWSSRPTTRSSRRSPSRSRARRPRPASGSS